MMASHHHHEHHLLDMSSSPNATAIISSFDHAAGLLSLHDVAAAEHHHLRGGGGGGLQLPSPWSQQQVSLSLYNNAAGAAGSPPSSLVAHQQLAAAQPLLFQLRGSKYLGPVKALLAEFCSLDVEAMDGAKQQRAPNPKIGKWDDVEGSGSWGNLSLTSMDLLDLERRKARILSMVEEVDRRYRRYREQMRAVEVSFEAVAGGGAAQVYTKLAMRAMSRHFRCLRDALVGQVRALRKAMGESQRDAAGGGVATAAPGATKGDTPRLRVLDQCLRQQRAFQQSGAIDNFPWRPQRGLPEHAVAVLRAWLFEHFLHPYPNDVDKHILARQTGLSRSQVSNWFINARVRLWKPMIEDMYKEETKPESSDGNNKLNPSAAGNKQQHRDRDDNKNYTATTTAAASLVQQSSYHLHLRSSGNPNSSSLMIPAAAASTSIDHHHHDGSHQLLGSHSYSSAAGLHHGGAVSLTLGLQQQQQPFAASMMQQQSFMVEAAEEEEEDDVLPYRNLMESQLLHDFAG